MRPPCLRSSLFPYTTLFRSEAGVLEDPWDEPPADAYAWTTDPVNARSEEHTSELQSLRHLVCRLLLEKKKRAKRIGGLEHGRLTSRIKSPSLRDSTRRPPFV